MCSAPKGGTPENLCEIEQRRRLVLDAFLEKPKSVTMVHLETRVSKPEIYRWFNIKRSLLYSAVYPIGKMTCEITGRTVWYFQTDAKGYESYKSFYAEGWNMS